jgi:adenylosuccinate synthase
MALPLDVLVASDGSTPWPRGMPTCNGFSSIAVTKLDVLDGMETLRLCTGYLLDGTVWKSVPATPDLSRVTPQYEEMPGWSESTGGVRIWNDLPANAFLFAAN